MYGVNNLRLHLLTSRMRLNCRRHGCEVDEATPEEVATLARCGNCFPIKRLTHLEMRAARLAEASK